MSHKTLIKLICYAFLLNLSFVIGVSAVTLLTVREASTINCIRCPPPGCVPEPKPHPYVQVIFLFSPKQITMCGFLGAGRVGVIVMLHY